MHTKIVVRKDNRKRPIGRRRKYEDDININLKESRCGLFLVDRYRTSSGFL
jgi:hypothetical protein